MNWILGLILLAVAYFLFFGKQTGVKGVTEVSIQKIKEYFMNNGSLKPYPGGSGIDVVTALQNETEGIPEWQGTREGFNLMIDTIDKASKAYNVDRTILTCLIMTESQGDWNAIGDSGYWDFAQIKYVLDYHILPNEAEQRVKEIYGDSTLTWAERRDAIRDYLNTSYPDIAATLVPRHISFGSGQISTWKLDPNDRSTFDIICRANSARNWIRKHGFHTLETRNNHVVEIYAQLDLMGAPLSLKNRGIFDPEFNVYTMAYLLGHNMDIAMQHTDAYGHRLRRDKWAVLAGLFKYKNGTSAPSTNPPRNARQNLIRDGYEIRNWWYLACIEHGDGTADPYMSKYDEFARGSYLQTFNDNYLRLTGNYLWTETELMTDYRPVE